MGLEIHVFSTFLVVSFPYCNGCCIFRLIFVFACLGCLIQHFVSMQESSNLLASEEEPNQPVTAKSDLGAKVREAEESGKKCIRFNIIIIKMLVIVSGWLNNKRRCHL